MSEWKPLRCKAILHRAVIDRTEVAEIERRAVGTDTATFEICLIGNHQVGADVVETNVGVVAETSETVQG